jgi:hypothetical protein
VRNAIALTCFFLSGFAGLTYQICWIRTASTVFGSTTYAVSTVVAVFFLGLALGSEFFGRVAQRSRSPLAIYAGVEIVIGLLGLSSLAAFGWIDGLYGQFYRELGDRGLGDRVGLLTLARVVLVSLVLLAPTFLMGGTLPLFCRQYVEEASGIARRVGFLYGVNTLGAAAGAASTGLFWIPVIGLQGSIRLGAAISIATGLAVAALRPAGFGTSAPATAIADNGWYNRNELLLIGVNGPSIGLDLERIVNQLGREPVHGDLRYSHWGDPKHWLNQPNIFLASFLTGANGLRALAGDGVVLRDDQPILEYGAAGSQGRFASSEKEIVELLSTRLTAVGSVISGPLSTSDQLAIRKMRQGNLADLKVAALLRRAQFLGKSDPERTRELVLLARFVHPENVHPRQRLSEMQANSALEKSEPATEVPEKR